MSNPSNQPTNLQNHKHPSCTSCCVLCKVLGIIAIIGALNWGLVGVADFNLVEKLFGVGTTLTRLVYVLVGISGLGLLLGYFMPCPACGCKK